MAFLLRTVTTSAEGREIVRTARVDGERLTIGRAPECDVRLADLAAALQHASVDRGGADLRVRAADGLLVALNGRRCSDGAFAVAAGGELAIAGTLLRFMPGAADAADISVAIERVTEGEAKLDRDDKRLFSLASVMPGKRAVAWLLALLILALCVAWPLKVVHDRQQRAAVFARFQADELWSSGHLSAAHAGLQRNCSACHVRPFEPVQDSACAACHKPVHAHADPFRLARAEPDLTRWGAFKLAVRQTLDMPPGRCADCHTEHEGARRMEPTPQRFCSDCHAALRARLTDTTIGDAEDFGRLHPDFRPAVVLGWDGPRPRIARVAVTAAREASGLTFPHALHLSKTSGVAQMAARLGSPGGLACSACHRPASGGTGFQPVQMERDCGSCHSLSLPGGRSIRHGDAAAAIADMRAAAAGPPAPSPAPSFSRRLPGAAPAVRERIQFQRGAGSPGPDALVRAAFSRGGACYDCHTIDAGGAGSYRVRPVALPVRYIRHGWFDHRAHEGTACLGCHKAAQSRSATDLLVPGIATCRGCHGGERTEKPVASSCAMCHDYHRKAGPPTMIVRGLAGRREGALR